LACFSEVLLNITKQHLLIKTADAIWPHVFADADAVQSISGLQNEKKMKTEPAKISFIENTTSSQMADQNDDFITKESSKSFSVF